MTALLGIMKGGAVYLPLNPSLPKERLEFIIRDARAQILLVQQSMNEWLTDTATHVLQFDEVMEQAEEQSAENPIAGTYSESPAYVIYTSGSTGVPKGVVLPHRTLTGLITWQLSDPELCGARRTLQYSSPSFDVSLQEVFATWCSGGTLVCIDEETHRDFHLLVRLLADERIERLFLPYVALQQLAEAALSSDASYSLRELITAGEQLKVSPAISVFFQRHRNCRLYNQYGPSETHVVSEYRLAGDPQGWERLPPIGSPVAGCRLYVLDRWRQPVPTGVVGELYIGGECLARGYLNQPDKTAEKFLPDSFSEIPGARIYRTGDLVRYRADGLLEFIDRIDQQLKIRGFRVEPGEIESCLVRHPSVAEAVVAARTLGETTQLVGFVVPSGNEEQPISQNLRAFLRETLPDYMIPAQLIIMDELPLTETGKLDRQRLSEFAYSRAEVNESFVAPRSSLEQQIAEIWTEVLGVTNPGINDNFFELGGHSLLATQFISRLRSQFSIEIPVRHLFQEPTIAGLALTVVQLQATQASEEDLAAILRDLEQLSVEDMESQP